jgi:SAM-dependent methyltransferase
MNWRVKAFGQRLLSRVPGGSVLYYILQRHFGGFKSFSISNKTWQAFNLLSALNRAGYGLEGKSTLEIGTGWVPIIPMIFYLFGQRGCKSFDINRLLRPELSLIAAHQAGSSSELFGKDFGIRDKLNSQRLGALRDASTFPLLLETINFNYYAPADARATCLPSSSVDIVFSNTTLEHIPYLDILDLFREAHRVLVSEGIMIHLIDCSDHFSHSDKNINNLNFLNYSDKEWQRYNSSILYQNRLRSCHYSDILAKTNFEIISWETKLNEIAFSNCNNLKLSEEFSKLNYKDTCTTMVTVVARRRES